MVLCIAEKHMIVITEGRLVFYVFVAYSFTLFAES